MLGPLPYVGGKSRLATTLIDLFPKHTTYVEAFCGGAQVFFRKSPSRSEVLNDLDGELVNFLRVLQQHPDELVRCLSRAVHSRRWHDLQRRQDPTLLTDVQRAARFFYLQRTSWGGRVSGQVYQYPLTGPGRVIESQLREHLNQASQRLERVQLENWPYQKVLERYDRPTTFFYLDPPYVGMPYYHFNLKGDDFQALADRLSDIKGRFLLSINDHPDARRAFRQFHRRSLAVAYSIGHTNKFSELVFSNYELPCGSNTSQPNSSTD